MHPLYTRLTPLTWAAPPETWSYTTLRKVKQCPLAWQLGRSSFGDDGAPLPERPAEATVTGKLVHDVLDALSRGLVAAGLPARGTPGFAAVVREVNPSARLAAGLVRSAARVAAHPRGYGVRLYATAPELYARVASLLQQHYPRLIAQHAGAPPDAAPPRQAPSAEPTGALDLLGLLHHQHVLSEIEVRHPTFALRGILDSVYRSAEGTVIADYKTGNPYDDHVHQLLLYALLWYRTTGDVPAAGEIVYYSHTRRITWTRDDLDELDADLELELPAYAALLAHPPATARPGEHCGRCQTRAWCPVYWEELARCPPEARLERGDLEIVAVQLRDEEVIVGADPDGCAIVVVFGADAGRRPAELVGAERVRILGGRWSEDGESFAVGARAEVFGAAPR